MSYSKKITFLKRIQMKLNFSDDISPVMQRRIIIFLSKIVLTTILVSTSLVLTARSAPDSGIIYHELTLYCIPSVSPLDWRSPASLHKSFFRGYFWHLMKKEKYLLGHIFVKLSTPLLAKPVYAGMTSGSKKEKRILVLKEKVGFSILGIGLTGKLETGEELVKKIQTYSGRKELAFITYRISEHAAQRILDFYRIFTTETAGGITPADHYGGAFWPRYENEGAGCSAFGLAMLDIAALSVKEADRWKVTVNIPMELIGGEINGNQKVKKRTIRKAGEWNSGEGSEDVDYVPFSIYDPSLMYRWILEQRKFPDKLREPGYQPAGDDRLPGLFADRRDVKIPDNEPVILRRKTKNFFVSFFMKKTGIDPVQEE